MNIRGPVVHVIAPSPAGGAESVVVALAAAAPDRTRAVILNQVAASGAEPHPIAVQLARRHVPVEEIRCGRRQYRAEIRTLERLLREARAGLVHTHGYHGTVVGYYAARRVSLPAVSTVHGYLNRNLRERLYNMVDRWLLRRFDGVIAVSQGIRDELIASGIRAERVHVIQNGLAPPERKISRAEARAILGLDAVGRVIGWIGRLSPEKGPDLFLEALARAGDACRAVLVGDGPEYPRLLELARSLGLAADRVTFAGFRPDAATLLPAFDALALTSRQEGTPMVILEAVAAEIPIVTFKVGGIPDLLKDDSAWLVPTGDVPALADALRRAATDTAGGRRRAEAARLQLADRLSIDRWLKHVQRVYNQAITRS